LEGSIFARARPSSPPVYLPAGMLEIFIRDEGNNGGERH
jgi:hypothetical protein